MSEEVVITTLQLDQESKRKLQELANRSERSMSAMVRWLINQEYERTRGTGPLPAAPGSEGKEQ